MTNNNVHFSQESTEWETPQDFYNEINRIYKFTLDPCCTKSNAKCKKYYTKKHDGLNRIWAGETVFMNPPYGREIKHWIKKAYEESLIGATVVCLIPARTDTAYWHDYIFDKAEVIFLRGRLKFVGAKHSAPFPSAVIVYNKKEGV